MRQPLAFALVLAAAATSAWTQPPPDGRPGPRGQGQRRPPEEALRVRDALFNDMLQERLGLKDDEFLKLLPFVKKYQSDRREIEQKRMRILQELRKAFEVGTATDQAVAVQMKDLRAVEAEEASALHKDRDAIDAILTPVQQAKFRILEWALDARIRTVVDQMRHPHGRQPQHDQQPEP